MLNGKRVVVTGVIAGESRQTAEQKLRENGALVQTSVSKTTDLLVTGERVGAAKLRKAAELGVAVVSWDGLWASRELPPAFTDTVADPATYLPAAPVRQIGPMLAKAGDLPIGKGWEYEIKWDGLRCTATIRGGTVAMQSRSGKSEYAAQFPHIAAELAEYPDCILDGELVVLNANGHSDPQALGNGSKHKARFMVFDVLETEAGDVRSRPFAERRALLDDLLAGRKGPVAVSPLFADGLALLDYCRELGLEGLVAKRTDSLYREGARNGDWIKVKVRNEQEFVVVGWKPGEGARANAAGSLLLAVCDDDGTFTYTGRVGTGTDLWESFTRLPPDIPAIDTSDLKPAFLRDVRWVEPKLVVQVAFQRWTEDGRLWHPSLLRVRTDKAAADVRREGGSA